MAAVVDFLRRTLRGRGIDVIRHPHGTGFGVALRETLGRTSAVVDVGANEGQFGRLVRQVGFAGQIVSYEPSSSSFQALEAAAANDDLWTVVQLGLGDVSGDAALRVPIEGHDSSLASFLPFADAGRARWGEAPAVNETVHIEPLDVALAELPLLREPLFLKIDTQGYDRRVLEGGAITLGRAAAVMLELPIQPYYEDAGDWLEMLEFLRGQGFLPRWFQPLGLAPNGALAEADCVLVRTA